MFFFLFSLKNIDCVYLLEPPRQGGSNEYQQSMFLAEIWKISEFLSENFSVVGGEIYIFEYACFRNVSFLQDFIIVLNLLYRWLENCI